MKIEGLKTKIKLLELEIELLKLKQNQYNNYYIQQPYCPPVFTYIPPGTTC